MVALMQVTLKEEVLKGMENFQTEALTHDKHKVFPTVNKYPAVSKLVK